MKITKVTEEKGYAVIALQGEVDISCATEVRSAILEYLNKPCTLAVDLSQVSYLDSSGVACLVEGMQTANQNGCQFMLLQSSEAVLRVLQLSRLDTVFCLIDSVAQLQESCASGC